MRLKGLVKVFFCLVLVGRGYRLFNRTHPLCMTAQQLFRCPASLHRRDTWSRLISLIGYQLRCQCALSLARPWRPQRRLNDVLPCQACKTCDKALINVLSERAITKYFQIVNSFPTHFSVAAGVPQQDRFTLTKNSSMNQKPKLTWFHQGTLSPASGSQKLHIVKYKY